MVTVNEIQALTESKNRATPPMVENIDIYITGMSNTDALKMALANYDGPTKFHLDRLNPKLENQGFANKKYDPEFFRERISRAKLVALSLWGNWYNTLALVEHPEPFDFIYPQFDESVDDTRRLIPFTQLKRLFGNRARNDLSMLPDIRSMTEKRVLLLEPPPPVESAKHILTYPGPFSEVLLNGVTPSAIRRKLWKLQSEAFREVCNAHRIDFMPFPAEATSETGFLAPDYCFLDPTHGNAKCGELILSKLEAILEEA